MVNTQRLDQNRRQAAASLSDVWTIPEPLWSYSERVFELRWSINNLIEDDQIEFRFYDQNCQDGNNELPLEGTGYTISQPIPSGPIGDGTGTREFEVTFTTIVPDIQDNTVIYTATGANTARADLCVRLGLSTPSSALSQEVNWAESIMRLQYDFEGGFSFRNITVVPPERTSFEIPAMSPSVPISHDLLLLYYIFLLFSYYFRGFCRCQFEGERLYRLRRSSRPFARFGSATLHRTGTFSRLGGISYERGAPLQVCSTGFELHPVDRPRFGGRGALQPALLYSR